MSSKKDLFSDEELIAGIRSGGALRERCINFLLDHWAFLIPKMRKHYTIDKETAEELYLDAAFVLYEHIQSGQFREESKIATYLYRVYSNKCIDFIRKKTIDKTRLFEQVPDQEDPSGTILKTLILKEDFERAITLMDRLGEFCKKLLLDALYWDYSLEEIAKRHQLKDTIEVSKKKYRCLQKLKGLRKK